MNANGKHLLPDLAALGAMAARQAPVPTPQAADPVQIFQQFFGLSVPTVQAMRPNVVPCLCGKCQGVGVQIEARLHFTRSGMPEIIARGDAVTSTADLKK